MARGRFVLLRGTAWGPAYLMARDQPDDVDTWTENRGSARVFTDRDAAEAERAAIVVSSDFALALVPLDPERVGPGPDRPAVHDIGDGVDEVMERLSLDVQERAGLISPQERAEARAASNAREAAQQRVTTAMMPVGAM